MSNNKSIAAIPSWFIYVAFFALIWNVMGVIAFISQITMTAEMLAKLPQAEQDLYANIPLWATIAFALAVWGGLLGCIALMLKKSIACQLFVLSLIGVCVQMFHSFFISNSFDVFGPGGAIMPVMVIIIAIALVRFSFKAKNRQWLN